MDWSPETGSLDFATLSRLYAAESGVSPARTGVPQQDLSFMLGQCGQGSAVERENRAPRVAAPMVEDPPDTGVVPDIPDPGPADAAHCRDPSDHSA
jgi:hypothetical protein